MEKEVKRKRNRRFGAGVALILCTCTLAHATILYIEQVILTIGSPIAPVVTFYTYSSGSGSLSLSSVSVGPPTLKLEGISGNGGYTISSAKVTISSALVEDTSSGGLAKGEFEGGGTLTLTGTLKHDGTVITPANTNLIVANMVIDSSQTWVLEELDVPGSITIDNSSIVQFLPGTTGLGSGITHGSDILKIGNFKADFSFKSVSPPPNNFSTGDLSGTASTIQIQAITPEPATITLFTIAALALRINKKK